jgi:hypothetical protein
MKGIANGPKRIAIVHEWLVTYAGSERALEQILHCYPDADLYSLVDFLPQSERGISRSKTGEDFIVATARSPPSTIANTFR